MANTDFQNGVVLGSVAGGNIQTSAPSGDIEITENGEYDVTAYETATVNVAGGATVAFLNVVYETGDTVTCTDGTTILTSDTSGNYVFELNATGNWIVSLGNKTKTINAVYGNVYYVVMFNALPDTDRNNNNVLAEAYVADYDWRTTDWGNFTLVNPRFISVENNALRMADVGKARYTLPNTNQSFTVYGVMNRYSGTGTTLRLLDVLSGFSSGNEQMFFIDNSGRIAYSSFLDDTSIPSSNPNLKHAYAMSFDGSQNKVRFYLDGVFLGEKNTTNIGTSICVAGTNSTNPYDPNCDVYFAAIVNEMESDNTIIANQQKQMSMFNIGS